MPVTVPKLSLLTLTEWVDDMDHWPDVSYILIVNYLVFCVGVDGEELRNYKNTEAYCGMGMGHQACIVDLCTLNLISQWAKG